METAYQKEQLRRFLIEKLGRPKKIDQVSDGENLIENGMIDSLGIMHLVSYIEDTFRVKVRDEEIVPDNFESLDVISTYVSRLHH
ncbi:MAG: hypothetical protein A2010_12895 [Nitrospirae bacterium GWD2_57_9]|nr:MAG: hypothetical protein A2010_12895 [Nitrospirae bacterium GWD2_57_9]OGW50304.1 MAG: hypothetical protein A2078_10810 [Nitrospirae bacterium GWC2_57_9]